MAKICLSAFMQVFTITTVCNSGSRPATPLFWPLLAQCSNIHAGKTPVCVKFKNNENLIYFKAILCYTYIFLNFEDENKFAY